MVGFDQSDIAASSASERVVERAPGLQVVDWGENLNSEADAGTHDSSYLESVADVPGHRGGNDGEPESVNMPALISPQGVMQISLE